MNDLECNSGSKYKVGDFVKSLCAAKHQNHLTTPVGSVGIIIEVDNRDELAYLVRSIEFAMDFWFKESDLVRVSKASIGDSVPHTTKPAETVQQGVKFDSEKEEYSLLPKRVLKPVMRVLSFGAKKYAKDNWQKVPNAKERYFNALHRHLDAWWCGEKYDKETGENHLAHAACCLLFLLWFEEREEVKDD